MGANLERSGFPGQSVAAIVDDAGSIVLVQE